MFPKVFPSPKLLIGVIHLPPLPGHAGSLGIDRVIAKAQVDLHTLVGAGFDGILVENDGDDPPHFRPNKRISESFAAVMRSLKLQANLPLGLEILYDMPGTIKLAAEVGADFVRLDVFVDNVQHARGPIIHAQGKQLHELRKRLKPDLLLLTDVQVKHTTMLDGAKTVAQSVTEAVEVGSDAVIVTGDWTGNEPDLTDVVSAKQASGLTPVFIGSGFSAGNAANFLQHADGAIVASTLKTGAFIDPEKAKQVVKAVRGSIFNTSRQLHKS